MTSLKYPITELENDKFQVIVDMTLYTKEALAATCYKFTDRFYIYQATENKTIVITFEAKDGNVVTKEIVKQFCNEIIDQQVRYNTNLQFGYIRDLIVEEAFKPVSK